MQYDEVLRQEYSGNNCIFSAGFVTGHEIDTMYIRLEKDGLEPEIILLRPDEMACIAWLASGVLWSNEMRHLTPRAADESGAVTVIDAIDDPQGLITGKPGRFYPARIRR